jgi:adenylyl cyclase-associated protein
MAKLEGNKWFVENITDKQDIVVVPTAFMQSVFIRKCTKAVITIQGKCNAISVEGSKETGVIFDDVIANVEVINSQKVQLQANGSLHNIVIEKTRGATVFLQTEAGRKSEIVTSNSEEVNIVVPDPSGDPKEHSIPVQFISKFEGTKLVTRPAEHSGN